MRSKNGMFSIYGNDFVDAEWDNAESANEKKRYYKCYMLNGGMTIKCYKPSVAKLVQKRTGVRLVEMK